MKTLRILLCFLGILLLAFLTPRAGEPGNQKESTEKAIEYLIDQVSSSQFSFIRNGIEYSSKEAADHIRSKYKYFISQIESPEDFIEVCASRSLVSGKPYLVSTRQGKIPANKWLRDMLVEYRKNVRL